MANGEEGGDFDAQTSKEDASTDPRKFDLTSAPEQEVSDFGDTDELVPRHKFFNRTPQPRELQKGVLGISEDSGNVMRLHVVNSKGEVKTLVFT